MSDHNIWPSVTANDAMGLRAWLATVGFTDGVCVRHDDGIGVRHSEMLWPEGGRVMVHSTCDDPMFATEPGGTSVYVVVDDPDAVWQRAARLDPAPPVLRPMRDEDYGSRGFSIADPEGNRWSFGTYGG